jgi:hypothetical protein
MRSDALKDIVLGLRIAEDQILGLTIEGFDLVQDEKFAEAFESLQILNKKGEKQSLIRNVPQETIWHWILDCRERGIRPRGICLKARQLGISTEIIGYEFIDTVMRPNRFSYTATFEDESAKHMGRICHFYHDNLPQDQRTLKPLKVDTKTELKFDSPHNSGIQFVTAKRRFLASSQTIHNLHLSELAKWPDPPAKDALVSVLQCVPVHWDTLTFIESSAYGVNLFKDYWDGAQDGSNGFTPFFFTWKGFPEYYTYFDETDRPAFTPEELEFQRAWDICDEQMLWARNKRREDCNNDWAEFHQEYPIDPSLAFKFSGRKWFSPNALATIKDGINEPLERVTLKWVGKDTDVPQVAAETDPEGFLEVWEKPIKGRKYVIGGDIAEGVGADFTVLQVIKIPETIFESPQQVAKFRSNTVGAYEAGVWAYQLGLYYNWAFEAIEINNQGHLTCGVLERGGNNPRMRTGYPNLFYHKSFDRKTQEEQDCIGWRTTASSKDLMFGQIQTTVDSTDIVINSNDTYLEMEGFSWDSKKRKWVAMYRNARTGMSHDDEVYSLAIAIQAMLHRKDSAKDIGDDGDWG